MYISLWRVLPSNDNRVKAAMMLGIVVVFIVVLFFGVFPVIEHFVGNGSAVVG